MIRLFQLTSRLLVASILLALLVTSNANAQRLTRVSDFEFKGTVRSIKPGQLVIQKEDGTSAAYKVQDADEDAVSLDGKLRFRMPAEISFAGTLPFNLLERGMVVRFDAAVSRGGKTKGEVASLKIVDVPPDQLIVTSDQPAKAGSYPTCQVTGQVLRLIRNKVHLTVRKSDHCKQERVTITLAKDATFDISGVNLNRVRAGDEVTLARGVKLSTGHNVISKIDIRLTAKRKAATTSFHDLLEQKYSSLSDDPRDARQERSDHFVLYTDLSDRNAAVLLEKLETMHNLIGRYYNKRPDNVIECFVVKDLRKFDGSLPRAGAQKIADGAGVTMSRSNGTVTLSVVYSCDKQRVVQHEAVHAFCSQAFGTAGPTWYAEGMAEMGQYWKPGEVAVNIDPVVIDYLTNAEPKKLLDIVAAGQITGDSWQAYAWRWALCYMMASNPNYQRDFKRLGVAMMQGDPDATFENAYGKVAYEVSFEYDQFVKHFGNGYRADICAWDWKTKGEALNGKGRVGAEVKAAAGWQSTKLEVRANKQYDFITQGEWTIYEEGDPITADGNESGLGRLVAAILTQKESGEFELSEPFDLGTQGSFTAPQDGQIVVRCEDEWTELSDNDGEIQLYFRLTAKK